MQKFKIELLFHIIGIGSASGLFYKDNSLFLISDSSNFLYEYHIAEKELHKIRLFPESAENIAKSEKPDFESITVKGNSLYILGSGSTEKRNQLLGYDLNTKNLSVKDLQGLYAYLKEKSGISAEDFNIEGAFFYSNALYLMQRGNGTLSKNGIFVVDDEKDEVPFFPITLPKIKDTEATFTDATIINDKIYFLAAAENTTSTYLDGEVLGSYFGVIDAKTMTLQLTEMISDKHKFEGITFYKNENGKMIFLICEDNDSGKQESEIYKLTIDN
ncbi:DUF6929 family protein [Flavobacterium sp. 3HN19-14]|uniref:DUF6929 family protein n=1 Tax=Flavobacterium sp. 3HN19-14 TaxID=3448133 RepID=UPI003EDED04C